MVEVGQTWHMGGQYVPLGEPGVLYFTQIHQYGHMWWLCGYAPQPSLVGGVGGWLCVGVGSKSDHFVCT